jgi:hypothetical protein
MRTPDVDQRRRFERLCTLRALYARRGPLDSTSCLTLAELSSYARSLLSDPYPPVDAARSADSTV